MCFLCKTNLADTFSFQGGKMKNFAANVTSSFIFRIREINLSIQNSPCFLCVLAKFWIFQFLSFAIFLFSPRSMGTLKNFSTAPSMSMQIKNVCSIAVVFYCTYCQSLIVTRESFFKFHSFFKKVSWDSWS